MNNLNPDFATSFTVAYFFERNQNFRFQMIDVDEGSSYDTIGEVTVSMGSLMGAPRQTWTANLMHNGKSAGQIVVRTQSLGNSNMVARFTPIW